MKISIIYANGGGYEICMKRWIFMRNQTYPWVGGWAALTEFFL